MGSVASSDQGDCLTAGSCVRALTQTCPQTFGSNLTSPNSIGDDIGLGLFLDLENRAHCNGIVTAYRYCYYDLSDEDLVTVFFMVFRENEDNFRLVEGSRVRVTKTQSQVNGFGCDVEQMDELQQFQVQEDDIIAACTVHSNEIKPLRVHAANALGYTLQRLSIDTGSSDSCSSANLNSFSGLALAQQKRFALHLFAEIGEPMRELTAQPLILYCFSPTKHMKVTKCSLLHLLS